MGSEEPVALYVPPPGVELDSAQMLEPALSAEPHSGKKHHGKDKDRDQPVAVARDGMVSRMNVSREVKPAVSHEGYPLL
jgi:hypothetical protein